MDFEASEEDEDAEAVPATKTRSEGDAEHVVLDEAVDIDDGGVVAELDACHQHEHHCDH